MTVAATSEPPAFLGLSAREIYQKFNDLDWQQRQRISQSRPHTPNGSQSRWVRVTGDDIIERNRYFNIEPWASNRVKLLVPEGTCDYINASHITLKGSRSGSVKQFIATQGPKETSRGHFWQMIWNETGETAVIIMLTQTHEGGREKCFPYFPQDSEKNLLQINPVIEGDGNQTDKAGSDEDFRATVELLSSDYSESIRSTVRKLSLKVGNESKTVYHYLFSAWPDFSVPEEDDRAALLRLVRESTGAAGSPSNPRVVHCSAGVGRSGTFIALDYLLSELAEGALDSVDPDADPIADCVNSLREQRMMMVQGEAQFVFLYELLREQWRERHHLTGVTTNSEYSGVEDVSNTRQ